MVPYLFLAFVRMPRHTLLGKPEDFIKEMWIYAELFMES